jgi:uncharacterized protein
MDPTARSVLLKLARATMQAHLSDSDLPPLPTDSAVPINAGGAFVTIRNHRRLRGCIGRFDCPRGLADTIQRMAVAVLSDPRFTRDQVTLAELPSLTLEVSVLSSPRRVADPAEVELGIHGIIVGSGMCRGCYLPQVAVEMKWDREQFLGSCCADKAGLPPDAWKFPDTEIHVFTSETLSEDRV